MTQPEARFTLDGQPVPFAPGESIMAAATRAGRYIPHLCWHADYTPQGSCRLCIVRVGGAHGRVQAACITVAQAGMVVDSEVAEIELERRRLTQLLFVEGNHFCPSCEKSGDCRLQATAYDLGMHGPHFEEFYPARPVDASHPDVLLDTNRCILCELCVRASRERDGKNVFALAGHGTGSHLVVNAASGRLGDTDLAASDAAAQVCPVGAILPKRRGFVVPIGARRYDAAPISALETRACDPLEGET